MPFTPFHLGPGALFKAAGGTRFSFLIFGGSQVLMDIEPLVRLIRGDAVVHGITHTLLGALVIGIVSAAVGRPLSEAALRYLDIAPRSITWPVAFISAFVGTFSHIALDAVMHPDIRPFWPVATSNDLLGVISVGWLHVICIASGFVGGFLVALRLGAWDDTKRI